jgi:hypothetical protein
VVHGAAEEKGKDVNLFWGDIHNHNEIGYAEGTLERSFALAENALDFYAFTPHGWWPDIPENDEPVKRHHEAGFARVEARWDEVLRVVAERNKPGRFVTIAGWEWHSLGWGDYCIYFAEDEAELGRPDSLDALKALARSARAILIPHHPGYKLGWRGLDWEALDASLSPVVEVFSEHGNSFEPDSPWGMYGHSMGGIERSQAGMERLKRGARFGLIASSDDHFGYPGGYGLGLTAVYAPELTRQAILEAIKARHTYAVTGDRIELEFSVNGCLPGDSVGCDEGVSMSYSAAARDRIRSVDLIKNGHLWQRVDGTERGADADDTHLVRIEWGWDMLSSELVTTWKIRARFDRSEVIDLSPAFCGGAGSVTEMNLLESTGPREFSVGSFTSRRNARPVSSISFLWRGSHEAGLTLEVSGANGGARFRRRLVASKADLVERDLYLSAFDRFSSPKVKVHALVSSAERCVCGSISDSQGRAGDFYLLKVEQKNGQMAWSSPIWLHGGT